jgi:hypothetical protein
VICTKNQVPECFQYHGSVFQSNTILVQEEQEGKIGSLGGLHPHEGAVVLC